NARLLEAEALRAMGRNQDAYDKVMALRESFPHGDADSKARGLAYSILAADPSVSALSPFDYHRNEAALLLREGIASLALEQAIKALPIAPAISDRAEALWLEAQ